MHFTHLTVRHRDLGEFRDNPLLGGGNPYTKLHRLWLLQLRPDQVRDSQSQGLPPPNRDSIIHTQFIIAMRAGFYTKTVSSLQDDFQNSPNRLLPVIVQL